MVLNYIFPLFLLFHVGKPQPLSTENDKQQTQGVCKRFAYLKLYKVGSTTASFVLERLAVKHGLTLCLRKSQTCQAWTTHDTIGKMIEGGADSLREHVGGGDAVALTILRNPIERLISKYYFLQVTRHPQSPLRVPTYNQFLTFLKANPLEQIYYMSTFSRANHSDIKAAIQALEAIDVVGVTEDMDGFLTLTSYYLNVLPSDLAYKSQKIIVGRPKLEDFDPELQAHLRLVTAADFELYLHAERRYHFLKSQVPDFEDRRASFQTAQAKIDQRCSFKKTPSRLLIGNDCYKIGDLLTN
eukprot:m.61555 g.61555  ORF g.61555 m.61555 type:complete len:299 (+) comp13888_c0_seq2:118-1014(+)